MLTTPQLSPEGLRMAWLEHDRDQSVVSVRSVTCNDEITRIGCPAAWRFTYFAWAGQDRIVCSLDAGGVERRRLAVFTTDGPCSYRWLDIGIENASPTDTWLVRATGADVLLGATDGRISSLWRFTRTEGDHAELMVKLAGHVRKWVVDASGSHAVAQCAADGGQQIWRVIDLHGGDPGARPNQHLLTIRPEDERLSTPLMLDGSRGLYARWSADRDEAALARIDLDSLAVEIKAEMARRDLTKAFLLPDGPFLSQFGERRADLVVPHTDAAVDFVHCIVGASRDGAGAEIHSIRPQRALFSTSQSGVQTVWVATRSDTGWRARSHSIERPARSRSRCRTLAMTVRSSDGLDLEVFLTSQDPPCGQPAILWIHGGPWARDTIEPSGDAAHLAAGGYTVVRANYRGSTGRGKAFINAADGQWSSAILDDLERVVDELSHRGMIDTAAVAVAGHSFGGYAALMLAGRGWPTCAIAESAPVDLVALVDLYSHHHPSYAAELQRRIRPLHDLRPASPWQCAEDVRCPVLMTYGRDDARVPVAKGLTYARSLRRRDTRVELYLYAGEGHRLQSPTNRELHLARREAFLDRHMRRGLPEGTCR